MRKLGRWASFLLAGYLIIAGMLYLIQEKLIFLPSPLPVNYEYRFDTPFEELFLESIDGARLNGLHFKSPRPKGVILYFHGNAGNLARWGEITTFFTKFQYDVVVMDYRSYGKSKGRLSEAALYEDGQLFYDYALRYYREEQILLYGRSLGSGIATWLGARNNPSKIVLETPYYSLLEIAEKRFPLLPVKWLLKYQFKSFENVEKISCPITIFHGTKDRVIPLQSGKKLFERIPGNQKEMVVIEGGEHNNLAGFDTYTKGIRLVLDPLLVK